MTIGLENGFPTHRHVVGEVGGGESRVVVAETHFVQDDRVVRWSEGIHVATHFIG